MHEDIQDEGIDENICEEDMKSNYISDVKPIKLESSLNELKGSVEQQRSSLANKRNIKVYDGVNSSSLKGQINLQHSNLSNSHMTSPVQQLKNKTLN